MEEETNKSDFCEHFYGKATITIRFENRIQWQKYRKYILKTDWEFDGGDRPYVAQLEQRFSSTDDVNEIVRKIVQLLQLGFDVYSCKWQLLGQNEIEYTYFDTTGNEYVKFRVKEDET